MRRIGHKEAFFILFISIIVLSSCIIFLITEKKQKATGIDAVCEKINNELYSLKQDNYVDLNNINLKEVSIGSKILAYEYTRSKNIKKVNYYLYPLTYNNKLIAFVCMENNRLIQINFGQLVKSVASNISSDDLFAILYDRNYCYICTSNNISILWNTNYIDEKRGSFNSDEYTEIMNDIKFSKYAPIQSLGYNKE